MDITETLGTDTLAGITAQSHLLHAVLNTISDGVLVVDGRGKILLTNHRFNVMWRIPEQLRQSNDDEELLYNVISQLTDPDDFLREVLRLYQSHEESRDLLHFKDGRIYERISRHLTTHANGGRLWVFRDITDERRLELELSRMAFFDHLTGLPNRKMLADRMEQSIARAERIGSILTVCYVDLDGFKPINDQYGHAVGDRVLIEVSRRFRAAIRGQDTVARAGGDEFVFLLTDVGNEAEALPIVQRILEAARLPIDLGHGHIVAVSASIGVAHYPKHGQDTTSLIECADQSMYAAKKQGRNCFMQSGS